jgi:hypothetical protein
MLISIGKSACSCSHLCSLRIVHVMPPRPPLPLYGTCLHASVGIWRYALFLMMYIVPIEMDVVGVVEACGSTCRSWFDVYEPALHMQSGAVQSLFPQSPLHMQSLHQLIRCIDVVEVVLTC